MTYLTRDQILSAEDAKFADVEVPEWGGTVRVRTITGAERDRFDQFQDRSRNGKTDVGPRAFICSLAICDENGKAIFKPEDIAALGDKSMKALDRVFSVAIDLGGLGAKTVEELEKN